MTSANNMFSFTSFQIKSVLHQTTLCGILNLYQSLALTFWDFGMWFLCVKRRALHFKKRIITKSKSGMVTKGITHLATNALPVVVIQSAFSLLPLGRYLLLLTTLNRYQPIDSSGKLLFTTTSRNISIVRYRMSLVTILLLDLVMIR